MNPADLWPPHVRGWTHVAGAVVPACPHCGLPSGDPPRILCDECARRAAAALYEGLLKELRRA